MSAGCLEEVLAYMRNEGLEPPARLTAKHCESLEAADKAWAALDALATETAAKLSKSWGPRQNEPRRRDDLWWYEYRPYRGKPTGGWRRDTRFAWGIDIDDADEHLVAYAGVTFVRDVGPFSAGRRANDRWMVERTAEQWEDNDVDEPATHWWLGHRKPLREIAEQRDQARLLERSVLDTFRQLHATSA
jgi:hypothetical protein